MISDIYHPILIFNIEDFDVDAVKYSEYLKSSFSKLEWDWYLYRQLKLEYLIKNALNSSIITSELKKLFCRYFIGEIEEIKLEFLVELLNSFQMKEFQNIKPTRRRAMQAFKVHNVDSEPIIIPATKQNFKQSAALSLKEGTDWRKLERIFQEPPKSMLSGELILIIKCLLKRLLPYHPDQVTIDLFVHFTQIVTYPDQAATNSPEGIHQDGMDYIVSALVIERENVSGGESLIYNTSDSQKDFLEINLKKGWGILQPDKGSDLWHMVEPIEPIDKTKPAYRSSIGIDFSFAS